MKKIDLLSVILAISFIVTQIFFSFIELRPIEKPIETINSINISNAESGVSESSSTSVKTKILSPRQIVPTNQDSAEKTEETTQVSTIKMIMVGDMLIHKTLYNSAKTNTGYDFKPIIENIKPIIKQYDIAFYNQETILGGTEIGLSTYPQFNSPYEVGDAMIDAGFNIVSLANNHTMDRGEKAILNSTKYWKNHPDILTAGSYSTIEDRNNVDIRTKNGISYTLLAYTFGTNGIKVPDSKQYLANIFTKEKAKQDIERVRNKVDLLIVSMHWGNEYSNIPSSAQKEQAKYLASLGVDLIIGHHPHVVEPVETIGKTVVFYSLGNFLSAQIGTNKLVGLMPSLQITKKVVDGKSLISIEHSNEELLYTYYKNFNNFKVIPFSQISSKYLPNYLKEFNTFSSIVKKYDQSIQVSTPKN